MTDKMTFGYLCEEALLSNYEGLIASERSGKCTKDHYKKLGGILGFRVYGKIPTARRIAAAILAAILICLGGCMAFGGRERGEPQFFRAEQCAVYGDFIFYNAYDSTNQGLCYQKFSIWEQIEGEDLGRYLVTETRARPFAFPIDF